VLQCAPHVAAWVAVIVWLTGVSAGTAGAADLRVDAANNKGVVELETGGSSGTSIRVAEDLAGIVNDGATRRVLPVVGTSAVQNIWDLALLRGIDMAIVQADVLDGVRQQRALPGIENNFTYITKLYNEEFHLLARAEIKTIADLANQKVNVGVRGSGTGVTAGRLFELLAIPFKPVNDSQELALEKLRKGEIAAMAYVAGKPASVFQGLRREDGLHFIPIPLNPSVANAYVPTSLTAADYPGLIANNQSVDTVAVGTVLAVANLVPDSERYRNVRNFVDVFFTEFKSLLEPGHHPMWREVNLAAELPGWRRFAPAAQWLDRNAAVAAKQNPQSPQDIKTLFARFLDARQEVVGGTPLTDRQKQELYDQFQQWQSGHSR
jgi:TRAP transporter TAXI family solute receptor